MTAFGALREPVRELDPVVRLDAKIPYGPPGCNGDQRGRTGRAPSYSSGAAAPGMLGRVRWGPVMTGHAQSYFFRKRAVKACSRSLKRVNSERACFSVFWTTATGAGAAGRAAGGLGASQGRWPANRTTFTMNA